MSILLHFACRKLYIVLNKSDNVYLPQEVVVQGGTNTSTLTVLNKVLSLIAYLPICLSHSLALLISQSLR